MAKIGKVLNKRTANREALAGAEYIGRGGPYGNPFVIGRDGDRDDVYEKHADALACDHAKLSALDELSGKDVVCFCAPRRCHGDTLVKLAAMPFEDRMRWAEARIAERQRRRDNVKTVAASTVARSTR